MSIPLEDADQLFSSLKEDASVAILVQPNPDPDCLGAAAGISLLLSEHYNLKSKIYHYGEVSHPQNKSMVNILNLRLYKGDSFCLKDHSLTVVLDTDLSNTGFKEEGSFESPHLRIDHHTMDRDPGAIIEDVRNVGSTCSIVWEWLHEFNVSYENHADVVTAMILGIKTDTNDFSAESTADLDFEAFRALIPYVDKDKLGLLTVYPLPKSLFEHEMVAFTSKCVKNSVLVSFIGNVVSQKRDEIPIIADRFVRMDGISTAIVLGIVDDDLTASVRSTDSRVNVSDLCSEVFGEAHSGAKSGAGGARVPLDSMVPVEGMTLSDEARSVMEKELFKHYSEKIFSQLGEE